MTLPKVGGAPKKYKTPEELEEKFIEYVESRIDDDKKTNYVSITDFCFFAGFKSRKTFYRYEKKEGFDTVIKRIKMFIFSEWEKNLYYPGRNSTGSMFWLKNFAGMADKVEHQHYGEVEHTHRPELEGLDTETLDKLRSAFDDNQEDQVIDVTED